MKNKHNFVLTNRKTIKSQDIEVFEYTHILTGAKLVFIKNKDKNKSFTIGFKTLIENNTGVPHILEHSVLCGSKKYNIKEPFVELMKGSLNTFLNATTYDDMTIYPVASQNDKDFKNLMGVYLDAVFNPNITSIKEIFMQEGWHYEIVDDKLIRNGVVYNEMKGVFSNPMAILRNKSYETIFDNCYQYVSGGDPSIIPQLTYERYIEFYKKYYHPTNSCTVLYGDIDIDDILPIIDIYFSEYSKLSTKYIIEKTTPFEEPVEEVFTYNINENESNDKKSYLAINYLIDETLDKTKSLAFEVLSTALIKSQASKIKYELLTRGLCGNVNSVYDDYKSQSVLTINITNINPKDKDEILEIINKSFKNIVENGLDKNVLESVINRLEFSVKEIKETMFPPCIAKSISVIKRWNYDPNTCTEGLCYDKELELLNKYKETNYFEDLIKRYLIDNNHKAIILLNPKKNLALKEYIEDCQQLEKIKSNLTQEEFNKVLEGVKKLKDRQEKKDSVEELKCMPSLDICDINEKIQEYKVKEDKIEDVKVLINNTNTNSIVYGTYKFDISMLDEEELQYTSLLTKILGSISTKNYTHQQLSNDVMKYLGGYKFSTNIMTNVKNINITYRYFDVFFKVVADKLENAIELIDEIIFNTVLTDKHRLYQIIQMLKNQLTMKISSQGHVYSITKISSMLNEEGCVKELTTGIEFYKFIKNIEENFNKESDDLINKLMKISNKIFTKNNMLATVICDEENTNVFIKSSKKIIDKLKNCEKVPKNIKLIDKTKVGYAVNSKVQYVGQGFNYKEKGINYNGSMAVVNTILSTDYLWNQVRVLGGAYGAMSFVKQDGVVALCSYRDSQLIRTLNVYKDISSYLMSVNFDETTMNKFIIGTIGKIDNPMLPYSAGTFAINNYIIGNDNENRQKIREEILSTRKEDVIEISNMYKDICKEESIVVVGNNSIINQNKCIFNNVENL